MKRTLTAFALVFLAVCAGAAAAGAGVFSAREDVRVAQTAVYGDASAANGLTVTAVTQYADERFWETVCTPGDDFSCAARYSFSQTGETAEPREPSEYLRLSTGLRLGLDNDVQGGISDAYRDLFEETAPGTESERVVRLADYYDYYPISVSFSLGGVSDEYGEEALRHDALGEREGAFLEALNAYFRIPVLEEETVRISIGKDTRGNVASTGSGSTDADSYAMTCLSAVRDGVCWFAFDAHTFEGKLVDTSLLPGGFGVYRLTFAPDGEGGLAFGPVETLCSLDPEDSVLGLTLSGDGSRLLVHEDSGGDYRILAVDTKTGETRQDERLPDFFESSWLNLREGDGVLAVWTGLSRLAVVETAPDGSFRFALDAALYPDPENPLFSMADSTLSLAFDGERLAVSGPLTGAYSHVKTADFFVAVYEGDGLKYYGEYASGLRTEQEREKGEGMCGMEEIRADWG